MTERCDLTDLLVDQCACRAHRSGAPVVEPVETVGQPFAAQYHGLCGSCDGRIAEGDMIVRAADRSVGYVHADQRECAS